MSNRTHLFFTISRLGESISSFLSLQWCWTKEAALELFQANFIWAGFSLNNYDNHIFSYFHFVPKLYFEEIGSSSCWLAQTRLNVGLSNVCVVMPINLTAQKCLYIFVVSRHRFKACAFFPDICHQLQTKTSLIEKMVTNESKNL
jgi:hypothetical protein